ncbi:amidohydrolase [Thioclava sp. SK-1]|uniref:amidohydrolase n=1 Tax=Thioclava sp. SK-1 TaxID=1889770 RepID=UPI000825D2A6|nr:amidohydrolase [Thioclava sp. SK-1]OCX67001.1 amidohydrolase [Thioclava sp. SK-1]
MPVLNRIAALSPEMTRWRHWLHQHPELGFDLPQTSAFVAQRLTEMGVDELHEGIATSGVVAVINGSGDGPTIGLRADMDALPITEVASHDHASLTAGKMHACGHDGHMAMLLGAAQYLTETRRFAGSVVLIFQPAEEDGGGGEVMVREGVLDQFKIQEVYSIHNAPNMQFGTFMTAPGPIMASVDEAWVTVTGRGGHAAVPFECVDPTPAIVAMVQALNTIVSRNIAAQDELVISVTQVHVGSAANVIADDGWFCATIRAFDPDIRARAELRLREIVAGIASAFGVTAEIKFDRGYPPTVNDADCAAFAADVAAEIAGDAAVERNGPRAMGAEDFAYMLQARRGAYMFVGTGPGAGLHHPKFDFNDEAAPIGASYFARLVEAAMPL